MNLDWQPLLLTFELAAVTTLVLITIGIPLAAWVAHTPSRLKPIIETLVSMPLVLPPSVLGFYLLLAFSPQNAFGEFLQHHFELTLVFSFSGLVLGSVLFSLPFMVQPVQSALQALPPSLAEASYTLGKSPMHTYLHVLLPSIRPALLAGTVLSFAHTIGEFGVVLMIGGNIPGVTRVASIAIFDEVESLDYATANFHALVLLALSFSLLITVYMINRKLYAVRSLT